MKTITIISIILLLFTAGSLQAQTTPGHVQSNLLPDEISSRVPESDHSLLDRIQMETESISIIKPFLYIAAIIDSRLELHRLEKESVAAARSRENGSE